jgi:peptide/nickel transport system substrate-binding protein
LLGTISARRSVWIVAALLSTGGCAREPAASRVRIGTDVDAGSLDPRHMRDTTSYRVVDLLFDGLVRLDRDLTPRPALATSWDNPAPTQWIFHLRNDARFHDGSKVTAGDVVYTLETILDPDFGAPLRSLYEPILKVEATDEHTVALTLREPYAPLLSYLDVGIVPRGSEDPGAHPIGSGPYRLKRWDRGSKIILEANADFWGGAPEIQELEFVLVPDNTARAQAFEAGDLDLIQSPLSPQDIHRLSKDSRFRGLIEKSAAMTYLNFNTARKPLDDPELRRAVAMLIDQNTILNEIYEGTDEKATSILLPSSWAFSDAVRQPTYDPAAADPLLEELGWKDTDGDGVRDRGGVPLSFELGTHGEDVNRIQTVEYLQHVLGEHGFRIQARITDWPSFSVRRDSSDYDAILLGWTQLVDPDKGTYDQFHSRGGLNWGGYRNAEVDELLERGRSTPDREERAGIYRRIAEIVARELPYYVLSYQRYHLFHSSRIEGFEADARGMLRSLATARLRPPA